MYLFKIFVLFLEGLKNVNDYKINKKYLFSPILKILSLVLLVKNGVDLYFIITQPEKMIDENLHDELEKYSMYKLIINLTLKK